MKRNYVTHKIYPSVIFRTILYIKIKSVSRTFWILLGKKKALTRRAQKSHYHYFCFITELAKAVLHDHSQLQPNLRFRLKLGKPLSSKGWEYPVQFPWGQHVSSICIGSLNHLVSPAYQLPVVSPQWLPTTNRFK